MVSPSCYLHLSFAKLLGSAAALGFSLSAPALFIYLLLFFFTNVRFLLFLHYIFFGRHGYASLVQQNLFFFFFYVRYYAISSRQTLSSFALFPFIWLPFL